MKLIRFISALVGLILFAAAPTQAAPKESVAKWADNLPGTIDPHADYSTEALFIQLNAYDNLYRYQDNPPKLVPWLAKGHTVSADGLTWDFTLREDVKFHDGSELTAEDVVYSFRRVLGLNKSPASAFKPILKPDNIEATGKFTVRFHLNSAYAPFLSAIPIVSIVNSKLVRQKEKDGDWGAAWLNANEAGSGAYKVIENSFRPNEAVELAYFPDYFLGWRDKPVTKVINHQIKEGSTRILALLKGAIDATDTYLSPDQAEQIVSNKNTVVKKDEAMRIFLITMQNQRAPFNNVHFRRALAYAFNYDAFIDEVMKGGAVRNPFPLPNNLWGYPKDAKGYEYDLEKAKAELAKAKADGVDFSRELELWTDTRHESTDLAAQIFQSDLRKLGVSIRIVKSGFIQSASAASSKDTAPDMWTHWVSAYFLDPENWIGQMYDSQFHGTWKASSFYKNDQMDKLLREARAVTDQAKRADLYAQATRLALEDSPEIYIYNTVQLRGLSAKVKGYSFCPVGNGAELRTISIE